mmetsp:Transcript_24857/g.74758  ORF Transcript_24857/g.74758 Transcript_24857/m.74758 type:complete len:381 (+) Transcript_24857:147-1289(+)
MKSSLPPRSKSSIFTRSTSPGKAEKTNSAFHSGLRVASSTSDRACSPSIKNVARGSDVPPLGFDASSSSTGRYLPRTKNTRRQFGSRFGNCSSDIMAAGGSEWYSARWRHRTQSSMRPRFTSSGFRPRTECQPRWSSRFAKDERGKATRPMKSESPTTSWSKTSNRNSSSSKSARNAKLSSQTGLSVCGWIVDDCRSPDSWMTNIGSDEPPSPMTAGSMIGRPRARTTYTSKTFAAMSATSFLKKYSGVSNTKSGSWKSRSAISNLPLVRSSSPFSPLSQYHRRSNSRSANRPSGTETLPMKSLPDARSQSSQTMSKDCASRSPSTPNSKYSVQIGSRFFFLTLEFRVSSASVKTTSGSDEPPLPTRSRSMTGKPDPRTK